MCVIHSGIDFKVLGDGSECAVWSLWITLQNDDVKHHIQNTVSNPGGFQVEYFAVF